MLSAPWYTDRLNAKRQVDERLWRRHAVYLESFLSKANYTEEARRLGIEHKLDYARRMLKQIAAAGSVESLRGTLGANPLPRRLRKSNRRSQLRVRATPRRCTRS